MRVRKILASTAIAIMAALALSACSSSDPYLLMMKPGQTGYIDATNEDGEVGDQALIEQKEDSGLWVVPLEQTFRKKADKNHTVEVTLTDDGVWVVDPRNTKVGVDHDDCLADGEAYAQLKKGVKPKFESGAKQDDGANDDCTVEPEA